MNDGGIVLLRTLLLLVVALIAGVAIGAGASGSTAARGSASAIAVTLTLAGSAPIDGGASSTAGANQSNGTFRYPEDGSLIMVQSFSSSASAGEATTVSQAVVDIGEVSLFGGEILIGGIAARARAQATATGVVADTEGSTVSTITAFGQPLTVTEGQPTPIADWGTLTVGATEVTESANRRQIVLRSLRLTLTAEHRGLQAGTEITLGTTIAELQLVEPQPSTAPTPTAPKPTTTARPPKPPVKVRTTPRQPRPTKVPVLPVPPDIDVTPELTKQGYVFPIFGQAWYSSTLGAARANTGWHHGTDIFAPFGAPVLAITDGTLFSVGWNKVGGYRLWLRDRQGNQFYYAHMAAYSPLAVNGREVRAGQVIGFNGNTGDAQGTPFHVHFEVHPVALLPLGYDGVVDPYPYLLAWRRLEDVALSAGTGWAPPPPANATAPKPAAILLQVSDISSVSGLEPGAVERAAAGLPPDGSVTTLGRDGSP